MAGDQLLTAVAARLHVCAITSSCTTQKSSVFFTGVQIVFTAPPSLLFAVRDVRGTNCLQVYTLRLCCFESAL
jgi:hypothetical protein